MQFDKKVRNANFNADKKRNISADFILRSLKSPHKRRATNGENLQFEKATLVQTAILKITRKQFLSHHLKLPQAQYFFYFVLFSML